MLKSKIHRAKVTDADVNYQGSLTLDSLLLEAADILPYEELHIWNLTNGNRLRTYAMAGVRDSGVVCVNGAAAHLIRPGDIIIIATFTVMDDIAARQHRARVVLVDCDNRIRQSEASEAAGPNKQEMREHARE
jgi:aspartate 1-decarboxylase